MKNLEAGILFIDEAYSLNSRWERGFEDEALAELITAMENYRDDFMVIFAGYNKQMQDFIKRNPGMKSRIPFMINFENYNASDLVDIMQSMTKEQGYKIDKLAKNLLMQYFDERCKCEDFANARECRNIMEKAIMHQASRTLKSNLKNNKIIKRKDIDEILTISKIEVERKIGFSMN